MFLCPFFLSECYSIDLIEGINIFLEIINPLNDCLTLWIQKRSLFLFQHPIYRLCNLFNLR